MSIAIEIQQLSKRYGSFQALKGLDLSVPQGQCVGLLGSNGAGKSTTIRMIIGQLKASSGSIRVLGLDPSTQSKKVHEIIGYIPDSQSLYDELSVEQNILVFAKLYGRGPKDVEQIIEKVALSHKKTDKVKTLSKGLRQRVLIARALVHDPKVLLLDEPTTGLDPNSAESIYELLESLKKAGSTLLLTTHLMNDVDRLCDKITFIDRGVKVEEGTPLELKQKYSRGQIEVVQKKGEEIIRHQFDQKGPWAQQISEMEKEGVILSVHTLEPKLEEIFIHLVGGRQ
ncbi:MAG: ABC transporter ATP-binding protein [Pseudomonadota bacterium]